jgi:hypothetical protein
MPLRKQLINHTSKNNNLLVVRAEMVNSSRISGAIREASQIIYTKP